ncbi:MAG: glycosyltransferase family 4 protein [Nitrososphaerota archaeon]
MLRLATAVSSYPFYNFRYLKLLSEFSNYFSLYVFAGSKLYDRKVFDKDQSSRVYYLFPFLIPRRIRYYIGGMILQTVINLVKPDIVRLFDVAGPLIPLTINRPVVLDIDDPVFDHKDRLSLLKDLYLLRNKRVRKIVVTTDMIKDRFIRFYDIPKNKIEVIPNGVDLRFFKPTEIPDDDVVLYYGTLAPHRSRFLVEVIENTLMLKRDVRFMIIGDVPLWFKKYLLKKNLAYNVITPGFIEHDKLPEWIRKAKVCIFTQDISLGGRFSSKLLDYMASGRPIVATDVDESWPVRESGAGIITPIDPKIFAENVITLLEDKKLAKELAEKGIEYARRFSWDEMVKKYIECFMEIIG